MKAIRKSDGKVIEVKPQRFMEQDGSMYAPSDLDFNVEETEEVTIDGWVARDKCGDIFIYDNKPIRHTGYWHESAGFLELPQASFPSLTWESDPLEVTVTVKPKKKSSI